MDMSPASIARNVYDTEDCPRTFEEDLQLHLSNGYVHATPDFFVMGRAVLSTATDEEIVNPAITFTEPDCWHVYLCAGCWQKAFMVMPYFLPLISWERNNKLRKWATAKILDKAHALQ